MMLGIKQRYRNVLISNALKHRYFCLCGEISDKAKHHQGVERYDRFGNRYVSSRNLMPALISSVQSLDRIELYKNTGSQIDFLEHCDGVGSKSNRYVISKACYTSEIVDFCFSKAEEQSERGSLLLSFSPNDDSFRKIVDSCYDVYFLGSGMKYYFSESAIRSAKKNTNTISFLFGLYGGIEQIAVFAPEEQLKLILEYSLENCLQSVGFQQDWCHVRTKD